MLFESQLASCSITVRVQNVHLCPSTTLQLLNVLEEWTKTLDEGYTVDAIYTDFAKAFDSVPHKRLLIKLQSYGVTGSIWQWIKSFLTNRQQRVVIQGITSSWADIISGVPQGSVL